MKFLRTSAAAMAAVIAATAISISPLTSAGAVTETDTSYLLNLGATSANGDFEYDLLDDGTAEITDYFGDETELVIPSKIDGYTVTIIGDFAFQNSFITSISIPGSVISIGDYAFNGCDELLSVSIPDSVISIGDSAFSACDSLTSITIPGSVISIVNGAFLACESLEEINVDTNNNNFSSKDGVLFNKSLTELITYPSGKQAEEYTIPDGVTSIGDWAFYACFGLTSVNIPDSVKSIGDSAFKGCFGLASITIPNSVTSIGNEAFIDCHNLTSLTISDGVEIIGESAFNACQSLTSVTIPGSVKSIGDYAFRLCWSLTSVTITDGLTSIGNLAFYSCLSLKSVTIPANVNEIGIDAFENCSDDLTIYGYTGTAAESYADENSITFVALTELSDEDTGIVIEGNSNSIPEGAVLSVEQTSTEENIITYDITLKTSAGETVQPKDEVTVMIPIPESLKGVNQIYVYYRGKNTKLTDMHAYISGNYIVFETTHFSEYLVTAEKQQTSEIGDVNSDGKVTMRDQMELARWLVGWDVQIDEDAADVNGDGKVTMRDQMTLARRIVGWDV